MKLIDIFNLISEGKCPPEKIKYKGSIYTYLEQEGHKIYQYEDYNAVLDIQCFENLNDEVEIFTPTANNIREYIGLPRIEEKKIPEKLDIKIQNETTGNAYITNEKGTKCYLTKHSKVIAERLNQVIDYLQSKGE